MSKSKKLYDGKVVSKSGNKTIKVLTSRRKRHPVYNKVITLSSSYLVHDENDEAKIGDVVEFYSCRPISLKKRWRLAAVKKSQV